MPRARHAGTRESNSVEGLSKERLDVGFERFMTLSMEVHHVPGRIVGQAEVPSELSVQLKMVGGVANID